MASTLPKPRVLRRSILILSFLAAVALHAVPSIYTVDLPGPPFGIAVTADQKWIFVSLAGRRNGRPLGVAVLKWAGQKISLVHVVPLPSPPTGIVLTHDGKTLVAAAGDAILLVDAAELIRGTANNARALADPEAGCIFANVTADDRTLFISEESSQSIAVLDLGKMSATGNGHAALLGRIHVGNAPIALTFSPDEHWLYTTSEVAPSSWGWPKTIPREGPGGFGPRPLVPEGAVIVIDVATARGDASHAVVATIPAGGSPVRLAIAPAGDRIFVTARNSNAVLVFDTAALLQNPREARIATITVGPGPVPLALADRGRKLIVGNSNRFGRNPDAPSTLTVLDTTRLADGNAAVLGTIGAGAFPRDLRLSPDGETLFVANYLSNSLQVINVATLSPARANDR